MPFAKVLSEYETFVGTDLNTELATFQSERRRLTSSIGESGHHLDLNVERELQRTHAFLLVEPASSMSDGAASGVSAGYFDDNNMPPWDTWIMPLPLLSGVSSSTWEEPGLLCWVPSWAREAVEAGIYVNPEQCLQWAGIQNGTVVRA